MQAWKNTAMNSENLLKIIFELNIDRAIVLEKCIKNKRIIKKQKKYSVIYLKLKKDGGKHGRKQ